MLDKIKMTAAETVDPQCFVLFILSHGEEINGQEVVYGTDGRYLTKKQIIAELSGVNCPHLRGVPRLVFFQCCRGSTTLCHYCCLSIQSFLAGVSDTE